MALIRPEPQKLGLIAVGSMIQALGISSIHAFSDLTEGGIIGLTLLFSRWTGLSPALYSVILNALCYFIGWRTLGREFLMYSIASGAIYAASYACFACFAPVFPRLLTSPLLCAVAGAMFVGVGAGLCVRAGGATTGDDALAMSFSHRLHLRISTIYLITDLTVLALSLTYIPFQRIIWSLLTVVLSGQIIGLIAHMGKRKA